MALVRFGQPCGSDITTKLGTSRLKLERVVKAKRPDETLSGKGFETTVGKTGSRLQTGTLHFSNNEPSTNRNRGSGQFETMGLEPTAFRIWGLTLWDLLWRCACCREPTYLGASELPKLHPLFQPRPKENPTEAGSSIDLLRLSQSHCIRHDFLKVKVIARIEFGQMRCEET